MNYLGAAIHILDRIFQLARIICIARKLLIMCNYVHHVQMAQDVTRMMEQIIGQEQGGHSPPDKAPCREGIRAKARRKAKARPGTCITCA